MPDLLSVFEFAAKTVRHISREFRVAWVSGVEAAQRDALTVFEAENEFLEPQSADFNDEALAAGYEQLAADPEFMQYQRRSASRDGRSEAKPDCLKCSYCPVNDGDACLLNCDCEKRNYFRSGGQTYETGPRPTLSVPRYALRTGSVADCLKDAYCAIKAENPNAIVTTAPAASAVVEDPSGAGTPLLASEADSIRDVLAEHYLESLSDRRIVGCRCGLELGSRQQHWDHQADLIAGALKARTQAQK